MGELSGIACALKDAKSNKEQHRNKPSIPALAQWRTVSSRRPPLPEEVERLLANIVHG